MLLGMEKIQLLARLGKPILGQVPNPNRSIGDNQDLLGVMKSSSHRFGIQLRAQAVDPPTRRDVTSRQDDRTLSRTPDPISQPKHRRVVNPMPARGLQTFFAQFLTL